MVRNVRIRVSTEFAERRRQDKLLVTRVLNGLKISDVDIDRIYAKKLRQWNILDDILRKQQ